eukprot:CFRG1086T1
MLKPNRSSTSTNTSRSSMEVQDVDDIEELGFDRKEMYSESVAGSVPIYHRHVFLVWKVPSTWPAKVELMLGSPSELCLGIKKLSKKTGLITKFTLCEADPFVGDREGDLLVYPERKRFRDISTDEFLNDVLHEGQWGKGQPIRTSDIFVCAHAARDMRCGKCGPELIETIKTCADDHRTKLISEHTSNTPTLASTSSPDEHSHVGVSVRGCSHVGSHKYAGNVIVYGSDTLKTEEERAGDWFGYICPKDAMTIVKRALGEETNVPLLKMWRGRLGLNKPTHKQMVEEAVKDAVENKDGNPAAERHGIFDFFGFRIAIPSAIVAVTLATVIARGEFP